jgi:hypothetical protein
MQEHIRNGLLSALVAAVVLLLVVPLSYKTKNESTNKIMLATGVLDANDPVNMKLMGEISGQRQFIVQIKDHTVKKRVEKELGVKFGDYIPKNTYVIKGIVHINAYSNFC